MKAILTIVALICVAGIAGAENAGPENAGPGPMPGPTSAPGSGSIPIAIGILALLLSPVLISWMRGHRFRYAIAAVNAFAIALPIIAMVLANSGPTSSAVSQTNTLPLTLALLILGAGVAWLLALVLSLMPNATRNDAQNSR